MDSDQLSLLHRLHVSQKRLLEVNKIRVHVFFIIFQRGREVSFDSEVFWVRSSQPFSYDTFPFSLKCSVNVFLFCFVFFLWSIQKSPLRITDTFFHILRKDAMNQFLLQEKTVFQNVSFTFTKYCIFQVTSQVFISSLRISKQGLFQRRRDNT